MIIRYIFTYTFALLKICLPESATRAKPRRARSKSLFIANLNIHRECEAVQTQLV